MNEGDFIEKAKQIESMKDLNDNSFVIGPSLESENDRIIPPKFFIYEEESERKVMELGLMDAVKLRDKLNRFISDNSEL